MSTDAERDEKALEIRDEMTHSGYDRVGDEYINDYAHRLRANWDRERAEEIRVLKEQHAFAIYQITCMAESRLASERAKWERELAQEKPVGIITASDGGIKWSDKIPPIRTELFIRLAAAQPVPQVRGSVPEHVAFDEWWKKDGEAKMQYRWSAWNGWLARSKRAASKETPT